MVRSRSALIPIALALGSNVGCSDEEASPEILSFESNLSAVATGRPVQLSWEVRNAERVDIVAQPDTLILDGGREPSGRIQSPPIQRTTVFRLDAVGAGQTVSASVRVTALGSSETVRVVSFTAEPGAVRPGAAAELQWRTEGANSGTLRTGDGVILSTNLDLPAGSFEVSPDASTDYELELVGSGGLATAQTRIIVLRPEVRELTVTPSSIQRGASATLRWAVAQASNVRIEDAGGATVVDGEVLAGEVAVSPAASTTYRLVASDGVEQTEALATLEVVEPLRAEIVRFSADPTSVRLGETSTLAWEVRNASRGVEIRRGAEVVAQSSASTGGIVVRPAETVRYTLTALSLGGDDDASVSVDVLPSPPAVLTFRATPNPAVRGGEVRIEWVVLGATSIALSRDGAPLAGDLEPSGSTAVAASAASTSFRITAINGNGATTRDLLVTALPRPEVLSFRASPRSYTATPVRVTLNWSTQSATSLSLTANNAPVPSFPPAGYDPAAGQFALDINQTTLFELTAANAATSVPAQLIVAESAGETEPNDDPSTAGALGSGGQVRGEIDPGTDVDWYRVDVPAGGNLRVETSDGNQSCGTDTRVRVFRDSDRTNPIIDQDGGGAGACARVDPAVDDRAVDLDDSPYFVEVSGNGNIGQYVLDVTTAVASCGNQIRERSTVPPEQCDDGPTGSTRCTSSCTRIINSLSTVAAGTTGIVTSSIDNIGDRRFVTVVVGAGGGFITARTWSPTSGTCNAGTELVLYDAIFDEVGRAVGSSFDNCAAIHPDRQAFAAGASGSGLPAGTYYLEVGDAGDDEAIADFVLEVASVATGCGNGVLEGTERCDDGNTTNGDGCSAGCAFEGTDELEPNDSTADATSAGSVTGTAVLHGELASSDVDLFSFSVPVNRRGYSLTATVTDGRGGCRAWSGGTDAVIAILDDAGAELASSQNRTARACAATLPSQQPSLRSLSDGTYHVRVEPGPIGVDGRYAVELVLSAPVCGNAFREDSEECDDGNTSTGDGCDACAFEIATTVDFSAATTATLTSTLTPDAYGVVRATNLPAASRVDVDVFDAGTRQCPGSVASVLFVGDDFEPVTPLYDQQIGSCNPVPSTLTLDAGDYYILIANVDGTQTETFDIELTLAP